MRVIARMLAASLALASLPAVASAQMFKSVDGLMATVLQEKQSSFSGIGLRMQLRSDRLVEQVSLMPTIEYWRSSSNIQPFNIQASRKDATLGMDVCYHFNSSTFRPYVGAGLAVHFLSTRVDAPSLGLDDATDSLIKGGVAALGGVTFGLVGKLENVLELKYHHIPDHSQFKINWGLSYSL